MPGHVSPSAPRIFSQLVYVTLQYICSLALIQGIGGVLAG